MVWRIYSTYQIIHFNTCHPVPSLLPLLRWKQGSLDVQSRTIPFNVKEPPCVGLTCLKVLLDDKLANISVHRSLSDHMLRPIKKLIRFLDFFSTCERLLIIVLFMGFLYCLSFGLCNDTVFFLFKTLFNKRGTVCMLPEWLTQLNNCATVCLRNQLWAFFWKWWVVFFIHSGKFA